MDINSLLQKCNFNEIQCLVCRSCCEHEFICIQYYVSRNSCKSSTFTAVGFAIMADYLLGW